MNEKSPKLTPAKLQLLLIGFMVLIIAASAVGFWFFHQHLVTYARQINAATAAATASNDTVSQLKNIKTKLDNDQDAISRAKDIVADSKSYQYQNQIINDLESYAFAAGITINSFTFNTNGGTAGAGGPTPVKAGGGAAGSGSTPTVAVAPTTTGSTRTAPGGLKSTSVSICINSPVSYQSIMNFLHGIEQNLTKMDITGISLSKQDNKGNVSLGPLTVEVYTR